MYRLGRAMLLAAVFAGITTARTARADDYAAVSTTLQSANAYISPNVTAIGHIQSGDLGRLEAQAKDATALGIPEKFAILRSLPVRFRGTVGPAASRGAPGGSRATRGTGFRGK